MHKIAFFGLVALAAVCFVVQAGSLEPPGPPQPTMKTLDVIPPAWSQTLQCDTTSCPRFELVMGGAGVLDKETGLVWEQSPSPTSRTWFAAQEECNMQLRGDRQGWRLPEVDELASLLVGATGQRLPTGHPFDSVQTDFYWSATTFANDPADAWSVSFGGDGVGFLPKVGSSFVWCVRGGSR